MLSILLLFLIFIFSFLLFAHLHFYNTSQRSHLRGFESPALLDYFLWVSISLVCKCICIVCVLVFGLRKQKVHQKGLASYVNRLSNFYAKLNESFPSCIFCGGSNWIRSNAIGRSLVATRPFRV